MEKRAKTKQNKTKQTNKKNAQLVCLQNELNSDVSRFTTQIKRQPGSQVLSPP